MFSFVIMPPIYLKWRNLLYNEVTTFNQPLRHNGQNRKVSQSNTTRDYVKVSVLM